MKQKMSDNLLDELWIQVFIRLPITSILCCTAVSQSWYSLIKSPYFISAHLHYKHKNKTHNSCFLVRDCISPREEYYEFYHDDHRSLAKFAVFRSPFPVRGMYFRIVGSCNGLLCLSDEDRKRNCNVILWNPFLKKSVCLPRPNFRSSRGDIRNSLGFGFDPVTEDYKVVRIVSMEDEGCRVEIFRLSTHTWEIISDNTISNLVYVKPEQAYLDGMVYWIGKNNANGKKIVLFDLSTEKFGEMELPLMDIFCNISVDIYMRSLAIVAVGKAEYCIWILEQNGCVETWTKKVSFGRHRNLGWPFGFRENGDVQLMKVFGRWDSFSPIHQKSKLLGVRPFTDSSLLRSFSATPYVESLVFVDKGNDCNDSATLRELLVLSNGESSDPEHSRNSDPEHSGNSDPENSGNNDPETSSESDADSNIE